jgi:glycerol-3-phosphate acyltransferase PlsY
MLNFELFLIILVSYLFGSIPFGLLLTKIFLKKDIREIGSGNIGATNVLRSGNKILGYSTLVLDILKAVLPILYVKFFMNDYLYISALSIFIGHVFPIWLKFKGGKGVASYLGILCCLDIFTALIFGVVWISIFILFKFSSLSSLLASLTIPIFEFFYNSNSDYYFYFMMFILIFFTHRENIKRLRNNTESKSKIY